MFENRDARCRVSFAKEMQLKPAHALKGWEFYTQNRFWPPDGDVTLEGMKNNIRFYADKPAQKDRCRTRANTSTEVSYARR